MININCNVYQISLQRRNRNNHIYQAVNATERGFTYSDE